MRAKITKRAVDAMKASPTADVFLWDTEAKGFGVRLKPGGGKSFVLSYYAPGLHQKRRRLTIGVFGPMTVDQARLEAKSLLARIAYGEDPAAQASEIKRAIRDETVEALFPTYLADGVGRRRASTLAYYESLGRLYILPKLGPLPVARVTGKDVGALHRSLLDKKVTANRVVQLLRSFFYWLEKQKLVSGENPASLVEHFPEAARERFLTVEEMTRLGDALRKAETEGLEPAPQHKKTPSEKRPRNDGMFEGGVQRANPVAVAALRFLILTGWREQEALTLRWDAVNAESGNATLEDTKTGRSVRAIPAPALQLVVSQPRLQGSPYVFPGRVKGQPLRELQRLWYAVRIEAKLEGVRLHDLRHSVASFAGGQGYSLFFIGKMLGHKDQRSTARYAHLADDARKSMADDVGEFISSALATRKPSDANVPDISSATEKPPRSSFKRQSNAR